MSGREWVEWLGWVLLHSLWQGSVLAVGLAVLLRIVPRSFARGRYVACVATLGAMLAAPMATGLVITRVPAAARTTEAARHEATAKSDTRLHPGTLQPLLGSMPRIVAARVHLMRTPMAVVDTFRACVPWFAVVWVTGVVILSLRMTGGWWLILAQTRRHLLPVPDEWQARFAMVCRAMQVTRPVQLLVSTRVDAPVLLGWWRPAVLIPASALTGLAPYDLELLLRHELAHVRRYDFLVNLLQSAAEVLLFHHPAAWWVSRQIREEREHCCDDLVVATSGVRPYVHALLAMEELRALGLPLSSRFVVGATGGSLLARVERLTGANGTVRERTTTDARGQRRSLSMFLMGAPLLLVLLTALVMRSPLLLPDAPAMRRELPRVAGPGVMPLHDRCGADVVPGGTTLCAALTQYASTLLQRRGDVAAVVVQDVASGAVVSYVAAGDVNDPQVTAPLAPASVWKLTLAALWWEAGLGARTVPCPRRLPIAGRVIEHAGTPHAAMSAHDMLVTSCNTAAAAMALVLRDRLGAEGMRAALARLGFPARLTKPTVAAMPDEQFWATTSHDWRARMSPGHRAVRVPERGDAAEWADLAIGEGVMLSPLHVARFLQAIGNDGRMRRPTIEEPLAARSDTGERVMRAATAQRLRAAMRAVVQQGSARDVRPLLRQARWSLGGKTGTWRQQAEMPLDGWFAGLLFDEHQVPRYAVVVFVRGKGPGGGASAQIAAELTRVLGGAA